MLKTLYVFLSVFALAFGAIAANDTKNKNHLKDLTEILWELVAITISGSRTKKKIWKAAVRRDYILANSPVSIRRISKQKYLQQWRAAVDL